MPQITRNAEIDLTPDFHRTVREWIEESDEILVIMRRLYCMGDIEFALISSMQQFDLAVEHRPEGTKVIVIRGRQAPMMGTVDPAFIEPCLRCTVIGGRVRPDDVPASEHT